MTRPIEAITAHTNSAVEVLHELQQDNQEGGLHRDFMQARLDAIEQYEATLKTELERCKAEKDEVYKHSKEVGAEKQRHRQNLARKAIQLISNESGEVTDRTLLWQVISTGQFAHHESQEKKDEYSNLLEYVDSILQTAHTDAISLPVLVTRRDTRFEGQAFEASIGQTDPSSNGLLVPEILQDAPYIQLLSPTTNTRAQSHPLDETRLKIPTRGSVRFYNTDNPQTLMVIAEYEESKWSDYNQTDFVVGKDAIVSYVDAELKTNPKIWNIAQIIRHSQPSLYDVLIERTLLGKRISRQATDTLSGHIEDRSIGQLSTLTITSLTLLITETEDKERIRSQLSQLDTPEKRYIESII